MRNQRWQMRQVRRRGKGGGGRAVTGKTGSGGNHQRRVYVKWGGGRDEDFPSLGAECDSAALAFITVEKDARCFALYYALKLHCLLLMKKISPTLVMIVSVAHDNYDKGQKKPGCVQKFESGFILLRHRSDNCQSPNRRQVWLASCSLCGKR